MSSSVVPRLFLSYSPSQTTRLAYRCSACFQSSTSSLSAFHPRLLSASSQSYLHTQSPSNPTFKSHTLPSSTLLDLQQSLLTIPGKRSQAGPATSPDSTASAELEYPSGYRTPPQPPKPLTASEKATSSTSQTASQQVSPSPTPRRRSRLRARKAAILLSPTAVEKLRFLLSSPDPKMIRIGVRNRGCSGLSYHLDYVESKGEFDEVVEQDGVKVLVDSKALFSIIGSEMDWYEDKLVQKFIFKNPNITDECGCGESFSVS